MRNYILHYKISEIYTACQKRRHAAAVHIFSKYISQFSQFFHWHTPHAIYDKALTKDLTTPQTSRYTTFEIKYVRKRLSGSSSTVGWIYWPNLQRTETVVTKAKKNKIHRFWSGIDEYMYQSDVAKNFNRSSVIVSNWLSAVLMQRRLLLGFCCDERCIQPVILWIFSSSSSSSDAKRSAEASRRCDCSPERSVLR